jgi:transposase-like protein
MAEVGPWAATLYAGSRGSYGLAVDTKGITNVVRNSPIASGWCIKTMNVLDSMPKSIRRRAKGAIKEITCAENEREASKAIEEFASEFGAKWPKAVSKLSSEKEVLLAFYDFPAEHWRHLRTTNPIESTFAPVRARTDLPKGPGSREAGMAMIYKLLEAAERRWRKHTGSQFVALVRAGARFVDGELVEGSEKNEEKHAARSRRPIHNCENMEGDDLRAA